MALACIVWWDDHHTLSGRSANSYPEDTRFFIVRNVLVWLPVSFAKPPASACSVRDGQTAGTARVYQLLYYMYSDGLSKIWGSREKFFSSGSCSPSDREFSHCVVIAHRDIRVDPCPVEIKDPSQILRGSQIDHI